MIPPLPILLDVSVLALGLILLLLEAFDDQKEKSFLGWVAIFGIGAAFIASFFAVPVDFSGASQLARFYSGDALALFYKRIALGTTLLVLIMAYEYRPILAKYIPGTSALAGTGEFFALPVLTCAGLMWMASAIDFVMIFVALELVTISFYVLVAYMRRSTGSLEAGVKYLILGALSTGFLVYGISWIYGITGQTNLDRIAEVLPALPAGSWTPLLFGIALITVGLGFKVAAVPFQMWVPDVYQGAPTPITAFLSVGSKAAGFIVLVRVLQALTADSAIAAKILTLIGCLALLTLLYGNFAAMAQDNFKRLLAYSSIGHAGYLLMALASLSDWPTTHITVSYYIAGYLVMTLLAFLIMIVVQKATGGDDLVHYNGLGRRSPFLAFGLLIAMISLAGIPFTAGFLGKLLVFRDALSTNRIDLLIVGVLTVGAGFYFYLKVVRAMYWQAPSDETPIEASGLVKGTVSVLIAAIFFLGIYPQPILNMLRATPTVAPATEIAQVSHR